MISSKQYDFVVIGGGIIGTASAMALLKGFDCSILIIEAENKLAAHQTGKNSGVIHSGLYYKPGSLKAKYCSEGREMLYRFCEEHNINYERTGKIVVAKNEDERDMLYTLFERGMANGLHEIKRLRKDELVKYEPHVKGVAGLFIPQTGIVDFIQVTNTFAKLVNESGGEIETDCKFLSLSNLSNELIIKTSKGDIRSKFLLNCGGLYSDRIAKICGVNPGLQIIPFRGEYYKLKPDKEHLIKNLIYPVPDARFPFLGVHFTRMINGGVELGPNALLALKREGYSLKDFSIRDVSQMISYKGFWKMASKYYKTGIPEFYRSLSRRAFVKAIMMFVTEIESTDIVKAGAGVRAQAVDPNGNLVDDFRIVESERMIHVLNAPSPAATASISIGRYISGLMKKKFEDQN
ncbi:MAG: L-2-hydroxyglutarate oxidase [Ignavibacterium sp.]|nr:MAG: L-2-hydroxyglutarate oxidase [Ignavibacterium sp.]